MSNHHAFYQSRSAQWDQRAGVRNNPERYELNLVEDQSSETSWHLPNYSAILEHSELQNLTDEQKEFVMGTQLLEFVTKQTVFEIDCVNAVASKIAHNKTDFKLSESLKLDALKIYTDEGYHAYYTQKVANQIREHYKIGESDIYPFVRPFYEKLDKLFSQFGEEYVDLAKLGLVIVGESQIVSDISEEMKQIVHEPIRVMFRDHMADEVFHAKFFAVLLESVWPQLDLDSQVVLCKSMIDSMILLGTPRTDIYYFSLAQLGFSSQTIRKCIEETYETHEWTVARIAERVKPTISLLHTVGVFKNLKCRDLFESSLLMPEGIAVCE